MEGWILMSGIAVFLPNETMCRQAEAVLSKRKNHVMINKPTTIDTVVEEARKAIELGANIVVARGHQASDVKLYTSIPTVEVVMTAQELGLLVVKAKKMVNKPFPKIGIFCWEGMLCDTTYFEQLYEVKIVIYHLENQSDWFELVEHAIGEGVDVLIGGEKCVRYATQRNFPAIFLSTTGESIEIAINQAETMYEMAESEMHSYAQFSTVLESSFSGIVKIGADGQVQTINRVMEDILKTDVKAAVGEHIVALMPALDAEKIEKVLRGEEETYTAFISNEKNAMVVITEPIVVENIITGAIISCNRTKRLDWSEDKAREKLLAGFVAQESLDHLLAGRPDLKDIVALAKIYAQSSSPILVEGNSYEEQEQLCQGIHNYSLRKHGPFVMVNAGSIPVERQMYALFGISEHGLDKKQRGAVVKANDGTLVIRGVDKLGLPTQLFLLNVIRKKRFGLLDIENESVQRVDTRIIACTSKDLKQLVSEGSFRKDLYYMLKAFGIVLPEMSKRKHDLALLLEEYYKKYLERHSRYHVLTPEAREKILNFHWDSGDVQLESFCERMILTAAKRKISGEYVQSLLDTLYDLSEPNDQKRDVISDKGFLEATKIKDIQEALMKYNGNRVLTASALKISTSTLWRYMKKYHLN